MDHSTSTFETIKEQLVATQEHVTAGTMMSSPGIQYKGKNFAFLYKNGTMCFRLGRTFEPESEGIHQYELLNPFRNKPPLKYCASPLFSFISVSMPPGAKILNENG